MRYVLSQKILGLPKGEFSAWINTKSRASSGSKKRYWREWRRYNKQKGVKGFKKAKKVKEIKVSQHLQLEKDGLRNVKDVFAKKPIVFTKLTFDRDIKKLAKVFIQLLKYRPKKAGFLRLIVGYKVKTGKAYKLPEHLGTKIRPINKYKQAFTRLDMLLAHVTFSASVAKILVFEESIRFYGDLQPVEAQKNGVLDGRH